MEKKYLAHIPTEQYGFISVELSGTAEEAVESYREVAELMKAQPKGLSDSEFRVLYDKVARREPIVGDPDEILASLSPNQRFALNECKKFIKRNYR